jgi:hypothetical protein
MSEQDMKSGYDFIVQRGYCSWFQFRYTNDHVVDYQRTFQDVKVNPSGIRLIEADQHAMERQGENDEKKDMELQSG